MFFMVLCWMLVNEFIIRSSNIDISLHTEAALGGHWKTVILSKISLMLTEELSNVF